MKLFHKVLEMCTEATTIYVKNTSARFVVYKLRIRWHFFRRYWIFPRRQSNLNCSHRHPDLAAIQNNHIELVALFFSLFLPNNGFAFLISFSTIFIQLSVGSAGSTASVFSLLHQNVQQFIIAIGGCRSLARFTPKISFWNGNFYQFTLFRVFMGVFFVL